MGLFDEYIEAEYAGKITKNLSIPQKRLEFLKTIRSVDGVLEGHPSLHHLPFLVDSSTGPLGIGAGTSLGFAYNDIIRNNGLQTFVIVGDGECQEGQIWESAMIATKLQLNNLIWIVDRNFIQIDGHTEEVGGLDNSEIISPNDNPISGLGEKFSAFGWIVTENWEGNNSPKMSRNS
ncbi:MAG: hypothetical protein HC932_00260 [Thermales bacterium]|nr:hypothetical protein [Thermales bacterium]